MKRLVYLGTPAMAVPPLHALHEAGFEIELVVTRPDARRRRGAKPAASPVKLAAQELGLAVSHQVDDVLGTNAELGVVVAFGQIIGAHILEVVPMVNLHFSLLPRWRGAAPVERAILAGDTHTGVTVMAVEEGLDTGGIYAEEVMPILDNTTGEQLRAELVARGTALLVNTLQVELGEPRPQEGESVYAKKISAADLRLDFGEAALTNSRRIRLGRAWCEFRTERLVVWDAYCIAEKDGMAEEDGDGLDLAGIAPGTLINSEAGPVVRTRDAGLVLVEVQPAGRKRISASDWWNGARPEVNEQLN